MKKNKTVPFVTGWMKREDVILREPNKDRYSIIILHCGATRLLRLSHKKLGRRAGSSWNPGSLLAHSWDIPSEKEPPTP